MLQAPNPTVYDLNFRFFGVPVRVSWSFWLMALVLGWNWSQSYDLLATEIVNIGSPGAPALLLIWVANVFLTILIHEMGHAVVMRYFGQYSHIVLYHFGGLAINDSFTRWDGARRHKTKAREDLLISAAGPAAQLLLALIAVMVAYKLKLMPLFLVDWFDLQVPALRAWSNIAPYAFLDSLIWTSIIWAVLNLAPILPLDGGQIMYNIMLITRVHNAWILARQVSIVVAVLMAIFMMRTFGGINGIMFLMFAAANWQEIQTGGFRY